MAEEHSGGKNSGRWVRNTLASNVGCRAVHRLKHGGILIGGVNVPGGREADAASDGTCKVGENVTEKVVGDNHVIAAGVSDHVDGGRINMVVVHGHLREFCGNLIHGALPQSTSVDQHIRLVHQGEVLTTGLRAGKCVTHHALHAVAGVLAHFRGDFVGGSFPQRAAISAVQAFRAFANHHKVNLARIGQR